MLPILVERALGMKLVSRLRRMRFCGMNYFRQFAPFIGVNISELIAIFVSCFSSIAWKIRTKVEPIQNTTIPARLSIQSTYWRWKIKSHPTRASTHFWLMCNGWCTIARFYSKVKFLCSQSDRPLKLVIACNFVSNNSCPICRSVM